MSCVPACDLCGEYVLALPHLILSSGHLTSYSREEIQRNTEGGREAVF